MRRLNPCRDKIYRKVEQRKTICTFSAILLVRHKILPTNCLADPHSRDTAVCCLGKGRNKRCSSCKLHVFIANLSRTLVCVEMNIRCVCATKKLKFILGCITINSCVIPADTSHEFTERFVDWGKEKWGELHIHLVHEIEASWLPPLSGSTYICIPLAFPVPGSGVSGLLFCFQSHHRKRAVSFYLLYKYFFFFQNHKNKIAPPCLAWSVFVLSPLHTATVFTSTTPPRTPPRLRGKVLVGPRGGV